MDTLLKLWYNKYGGEIIDNLNFKISKISQYDFSEFSLKNQYTGESGNTIIYPVRMYKKRISVTAEFSEIEYRFFTDIVKNPEFECEYRTTCGSELLSGIFTVTAVSFTIE